MQTIELYYRESVKKFLSKYLCMNKRKIDFIVLLLEVQHLPAVVSLIFYLKS